MFLSFPQMKNLELKSKEHIQSLELKVTLIKIKHFISLALPLLYESVYSSLLLFVFQNKDLELRLKEKEDQQSVAELKVLLEWMCYL